MEPIILNGSPSLVGTIRMVDSPSGGFQKPALPPLFFTASSFARIFAKSIAMLFYPFGLKS